MIEIDTLNPILGTLVVGGVPVMLVVIAAVIAVCGSR